MFGVSLNPMCDRKAQCARQVSIVDAIAFKTSVSQFVSSALNARPAQVGHHHADGPVSEPSLVRRFRVRKKTLYAIKVNSTNCQV